MREEILRVLEYCNKFDYPLTGGQVWERLTVWSSKPKVQNWLGRLVEEGKMGEKEGYYFLTGNEGIVKVRKRRERASQLKWERVRKMKRFWEMMPGVLAVAVTGSLAMDNADRLDDIDLMVIVKRGRLWLVRLGVIAYLRLRGWRRPKGIGEHKGERVKDKFCDNLYLDEEALEQERSLRVAYEIVQAKVVVGKGEWGEFLRANRWVREYLPNAKGGGQRVEGRDDTNVKEKIGDKGWGWIGDGLNWVAYGLQRVYMGKRERGEVVDLHQARFYPGEREA